MSDREGLEMLDSVTSCMDGQGNTPWYDEDEPINLLWGGGSLKPGLPGAPF